MVADVIIGAHFLKVAAVYTSPSTVAVALALHAGTMVCAVVGTHVLNLWNRTVHTAPSLEASTLAHLAHSMIFLTFQAVAAVSGAGKHVSSTTRFRYVLWQVARKATVLPSPAVVALACLYVYPCAVVYDANPVAAAHWEGVAGTLILLDLCATVISTPSRLTCALQER